MTDRVPCGRCDSGYIHLPHGRVRACSCLSKLTLISRLRRAGVPEGYLDKTFENFRPRNKQEQKLLEAVISYNELLGKNLQTGKGFNLIGLETRIGKSHLLCATVRRIVERNQTSNEDDLILYINERTLFDCLWAKIESDKNGEDSETEPNLLRRIKTCRVLALDDLGVTKASAFVTSTLYGIVEERCSNLRPILTASNLRWEDIVTNCGLDGERIVRRIIERNGDAMLIKELSTRD